MTGSGPASPALIAVDWGTTNRRAYLLDRAGGVLDTGEDARGLANVADRAFQQALDAVTAPWTGLWGPLPVLLSGMVGASTGWIEAPYCSAPAGAQELAGALRRAPSDHPAWIVPGVSCRDSANIPDVMRGEEIQALAAGGEAGTHLIVAPGTHSKWIRFQDGRIADFKTFMTGDLHAAILNHTVIEKLQTRAGAWNAESFAEGAEIGFARPEDLTHAVFGARTRVLFDDLAPDCVSDYLSGLLIGAEIAGAFATFGRAGPVALVGGANLARLYRSVLESRGVQVRDVDISAIGRTYADLATRAGILEGTEP